MICYPLLGQNGRFGNQLFQIAATISHAIDCNDEAIFPSFEANAVFKNKFKTYNELPIITNRYTEKHFYYSPIPRLPNLALNGYFQTEKYFKHNKEKILKSFEFPDELVEQVNEKYKDYLKDQPVGVQIRTYSGGAIDPRHIHCDVLENPEYLKRSFEYFGKNRLFVVVTDNYAYTTLKIKQTSNIRIINSNSFYADFIFSTLCTDNISSASSFGWWGSYLNKNKNKKVIMPEKWFHIKDEWYDNRDIYPEGVIRL
jgi:hypothetical protein